MENNKREWPPVRRPRRRGINIRPIALLLALVLLIGGAVGGVLAWLKDTTDAKVNTFTVGNIDIDLTEEKSDFKMVPGCTIEKDPKITVTGGSEKCWLFVKVAESENLDSFITYAIDTEWTHGEGSGEGKNGVPVGVYFRTVDSNAEKQEFDVITENKVTVKEDVTKEMMDAIQKKEADNPTLTFTAYAVQYWETNGDAFTPAEAWALANT